MMPSASALVDPWQVVQWPTPRAREWTRRLALKNGIEAIVAIGSAARGQARAVSDLDLVVVLGQGSTRVASPPEADVRWVDVHRLAKLVARGDDVVAWAVSYGLPLHDPIGTWRGVATEWRDALPLPTAAVCLERAARARHYAVDLLALGDERAASEQVLTMLTHEARLALRDRGVFPASRPELPAQLRSIDAGRLASLLDQALRGALPPEDALAERQLEGKGDPIWIDRASR